MKLLTLEQLEDVSGGLTRVYTFTDAYGIKVDLYMETNDEFGDPFGP